MIHYARIKRQVSTHVLLSNLGGDFVWLGVYDMGQDPGSLWEVTSESEDLLDTLICDSLLVRMPIHQVRNYCYRGCYDGIESQSGWDKHNAV
jgi:hypothetical protein